jgi:putative ABC transport system permease protein
MRDLRYGLRLLRNSPGFAAVAVLSLALGIGANTAIFSIINAVMLKLLPVSDPARLVTFIYDTSAKGRAPDPMGYYTNPVWEFIRDRQQVLDDVTAYAPQMLDLGSGGEVQRVSGLFVSGHFFDVFGVRPWVGRLFTATDDRRGGGGPDGPAVVISYGFWRDRYGAATSAIGSTLRLAGQPFTIVGVTPPGFFGPEVGKSFDVIVPLGTEPIIRGQANSSLDERTFWWLVLAGRLKPNQTIDQAIAGLRAFQPAIAEATLPPGSTLSGYFNEPLGLTPAGNGISRLRSSYRPALLVLMALVGIVLLIACANLANLLLARAAVRQKEFAVRLAIGASRGRIIRQMLTESLLLAITGALLGLAFADAASRLIVRALSSQQSPVFVDVSIDARVLAFTIAAAMATVMLLGMAPAIRSTRVEANDALKSGSRGIAHGWTRGRSLEKALLTLQIALSLVLVFGASLFVRSFATLSTLDPGFNATHVMQVATNIARANVPVAQRLAIWNQLEAGVRAIPGVDAAALVQITPVRGNDWNNRVDVAGFTAVGRDRYMLANRVSAGYFQTLGIPFRAGRDFDSHDLAGAQPVTIVSEAAMRKYFRGENPIGRVIRVEEERDLWIAYTIVGVVGETAYHNLRETPPPIMYFAMSQAARPMNAYTFVLRSRGDAGSLARAVTQAGAAVDSNITFELRPLEAQLADSLIQERLLALLSGFFGALALLVAGVGLYGMMSLAVTRRRSELGVRMALGAAPRSIVSLVVREVAIITLIGLLAGIATSLAAGRIIATLLFALTPTDPATCALAASLLAGVALLAAYVPACRAARVDPMITLRDE